MTIPNLSLSMAQEIVSYRNSIGRYKRIEDLVVVSGIGAANLQNIRGELTIGAERIM